MEEQTVSTLKGKTLTSVTTTTDKILFVVSESESYKLYHSQDCCESVNVEDINGDLNDLVGTPILVAEEVSSEGTPPKDKGYGPDESFTWTFYKFATIKGSAAIRFYGSSNGYYSERVDFVRVGSEFDSDPLPEETGGQP